MGANEKQAATYHGREYTPSVNDLAGKCINDDNSIRFTPEMFDRSIAKIRAEAKAEALDDFAKVIDAEERDQWISDGLHRPGAQIVAQRMKVLGKVARTRANQFKLGSE